MLKTPHVNHGFCARNPEFDPGSQGGSPKPFARWTKYEAESGNVFFFMSDGLDMRVFVFWGCSQAGWVFLVVAHVKPNPKRVPTLLTWKVTSRTSYLWEGSTSRVPLLTAPDLNPGPTRRTGFKSILGQSKSRTLTTSGRFFDHFVLLKGPGLEPHVPRLFFVGPAASEKACWSAGMNPGIGPLKGNHQLACGTRAQAATTKLVIFHLLN